MTGPDGRTREGHVRVGTCGFRGGQARTFAELDIVEVQQTFYQPPRRDTAERWRARAAADFVFTLKAWQLITHPASSRTYRRTTEPLSARQLARAGGFRWNAVTRMAWRRTRDIADALAAEAVVLQAPPSFRPTRTHLYRLRHFLEAVDRGGLRLVFEPRGAAWDDHTVATLCDELDLVHGVDPFLRRPMSPGMQYFRLHGRPAYHYRYRYTDDDLEALTRMLEPGREARVLFNNDAMADDARRLRRRLP